MRNTTSITRALNDRLMLLDGGSFVANNQVALEGDAFMPSSGMIWLRPKAMFAEPEMIGAFADVGTYRENGIYQVSIFAPKGEGSLGASAVCDKILNWFQRGTTLTAGGITVKIERSFRSGTLEEPMWLHLPTSIEFWSYSPYRS